MSFFLRLCSYCIKREETVENCESNKEEIKIPEPSKASSESTTGKNSPSPAVEVKHLDFIRKKYVRQKSNNITGSQDLTNNALLQVQSFNSAMPLRTNSSCSK